VLNLTLSPSGVQAATKPPTPYARAGSNAGLDHRLAGYLNIAKGEIEPPLSRGRLPCARPFLTWIPRPAGAFAWSRRCVRRCESGWRVYRRVLAQKPRIGGKAELTAGRTSERESGCGGTAGVVADGVAAQC
jgi:hypothetical protein